MLKKLNRDMKTAKTQIKLLKRKTTMYKDIKYLMGQTKITLQHGLYSKYKSKMYVNNSTKLGGGVNTENSSTAQFIYYKEGGIVSLEGRVW